MERGVGELCMRFERAFQRRVDSDEMVGYCGGRPAQKISSPRGHCPASCCACLHNLCHNSRRSINADRDLVSGGVIIDCSPGAWCARSVVATAVAAAAASRVWSAVDLKLIWCRTRAGSCSHISRMSDTLTRCCFDVGRASQTLSQH